MIFKLLQANFNLNNLFIKGNLLELIKIEEDGTITPVHIQSIFSQIITIIPLNTKKRIKFLLLNSLGYLGILTFNFDEKLFKLLSVINLNSLQVFYQPTKNIAVDKKNTIVACASHKNSLTIIPTSKYWRNQNSEKEEIKFDINSGLKSFEFEENVTIFSIEFLQNSSNSNELICFLQKPKNIFAFYFLRIQFTKKIKNVQSKIEIYNKIEYNWESLGIGFPYKLNSFYTAEAHHLFLFTDSNTFFILSSETNYQFIGQPVSIPAPDHQLISAVEFHADPTTKTLFLFSDIGNLYEFHLVNRNVIARGNFGNSGKILLHFPGNILFAFGEYSDGAILQWNANKMDDSNEINTGNWEIIYEIPNWAPLIDFYSINNYNINDNLQIEELYAISGSIQGGKLLRFANGIGIDNQIEISSNEYSESIIGLSSFPNQSNSFSLIVLSFFSSTRIIYFNSERNEMEDISEKSNVLLNQSTIASAVIFVNESGADGVQSLTTHLIIQVTNDLVNIGSINRKNSTVQWKIDENLFPHGKISSAEIRNSDILINISSNKENHLFYLKVINDENYEKIQIIEIHKKLNISQEISCIYLPSDKYTSCGENLFSMNEICLVFDYQPSFQILSLSDNFKCLLHEPLDQFASIEGNNFVHSAAICSFHKGSYSLLIGMRDGSLLLYSLSITINQQSKDSFINLPADELESMLIDGAENIKLVSHSLSVAFQSVYRIGIQPITLHLFNTTNSENGVNESNPNCIALTDRAWLLSANKRLSSDSSSINTVPINFPYHISHLTNFQSEGFLIYANNSLQIISLNPSDAFSYEQLVSESDLTLPNFRGPFKRVIYHSQSRSLIVMSNNYLLAYDPVSGSRLATYSKSNSDSFQSVCLWKFIDENNENRNFIVVSSISEFPAANSILFFSLKKHGSDVEFVLDFSFECKTSFCKFTSLQQLSSTFLLISIGNILLLGTFVIENGSKNFVIQAKKEVGDIIRCLSCSPDGGHKIVAGTRSFGLLYFLFDPLACKITYLNGYSLFLFRFVYYFLVLMEFWEQGPLLCYCFFL